MTTKIGEDDAGDEQQRDHEQKRRHHLALLIAEGRQDEGVELEEDDRQRD